MARLRPVAAETAIGYIRVSKERDGMISPELQMTAIEEHCARNGYTLIDVVTDLDLTGRLWKARQIDAVIQRIEAREASVVVVWKQSRVSRNRKDWILAVDRVEGAGGRLESATEPIDTSTSSGRFARGVLAELAAFESERIGDTWREAHARRIKMGKPANGKPRWGYINVDGDLVPDPVTGPVLRDLYIRYIGGESIYALVGWLAENNHQTIGGYTAEGPGPWSDRSLRRCLDSGFGAGLLNVNGEYLPGAHEGVITMSEWDAYRAARARRAVKRSSERSVYLLSGLVRCSCGSSMTGGQFGAQGQAKFRCKAGHEKRRHPGGYVAMFLVEEAVLDWLRDMVASDVNEQADARLLASEAKADLALTASMVEQQIAKLERQLVTLTLRLAEDPNMPARAYSAAVEDIQGRQAVLSARLVQIRAEQAEGDVIHAASDLLGDWEVRSVEDRREQLRRLISHAKVTPGRPRATIEIVPRWADTER